jgi:hypothetical protein
MIDRSKPACPDSERTTAHTRAARRIGPGGGAAPNALILADCHLFGRLQTPDFAHHAACSGAYIACALALVQLIGILLEFRLASRHEHTKSLFLPEIFKKFPVSALETRFARLHPPPCSPAKPKA